MNVQWKLMMKEINIMVRLLCKMLMKKDNNHSEKGLKNNKMIV